MAGYLKLINNLKFTWYWKESACQEKNNNPLGCEMCPCNRSSSRMNYNSRLQFPAGTGGQSPSFQSIRFCSLPSDSALGTDAALCLRVRSSETLSTPSPSGLLLRPPLWRGPRPPEMGKGSCVAPWSLHAAEAKPGRRRRGCEPSTSLLGFLARRPIRLAFVLPAHRSPPRVFTNSHALLRRLQTSLPKRGACGSWGCHSP